MLGSGCAAFLSLCLRSFTLFFSTGMLIADCARCMLVIYYECINMYSICSDFLYLFRYVASSLIVIVEVFSLFLSMLFSGYED